MKMKNLTYGISYIMALLLIKIASSTVYYVNPSNTNKNGNGLSWSDSFINLSDALDITVNNDQIWLIGNEIYSPPQESPRNECFFVKNAVSIYGGFAGDETLISQRPKDAETIISGEIGNTLTNEDNCYHVITYDTDITLDTVTIMDGYADFSINSKEENGSSLDGYGAGLISKDGAKSQHVTINNVKFARNVAVNGGALYFGVSNEPVTVQISNCLFINNRAINDGKHAGGYGGAIYIYYLPNIFISSTRFDNNYAEYRGGGIYINYGAILGCNQCDFENNRADGYGATIFAENRDSPNGVTALPNNAATMNRRRLLQIGNATNTTNTPTSPPSNTPTIFFTTPIPTKSTTSSPTKSPILSPLPTTYIPTITVSVTPSTIPTAPPSSPTLEPTIHPTDNPSQDPTLEPTYEPTDGPTGEPTLEPTSSPSKSPTFSPTKSPISGSPTSSPTDLTTSSPSKSPTFSPTNPPSSPITLAPATTPTAAPSSQEPTSAVPTTTPTLEPTSHPTDNPSQIPTLEPTYEPTDDPTGEPTLEPTREPTDATPTTSPTTFPIPPQPTVDPTATTIPTDSPQTVTPTLRPTESPTFHRPTNDTTINPTSNPTAAPSFSPTFSPTDPPQTITPTLPPNNEPSQSPTFRPTESPDAIGPNSPLIITCGETINGSYNNLPIDFRFDLQFVSQVTFSTCNTHIDTIVELYQGGLQITECNNCGTLANPGDCNQVSPGCCPGNPRATEIITELPANDNYYWRLSSNEQDETFAEFEVTMNCKVPTPQPSQSPTFHPITVAPGTVPTPQPISAPTIDPISDPTSDPTVAPITTPTPQPTHTTPLPTDPPQTASPTLDPGSGATSDPTTAPSISPALDPSNIPTFRPTFSPQTAPTNPTAQPTTFPITLSPNTIPTPAPTGFVTTAAPTSTPTLRPTDSLISCGDTVSGEYINKPIVWRFDLPLLAEVTFSSCNTDFDTVIELYEDDQLTTESKITGCDNCGTLAHPADCSQFSPACCSSNPKASEIAIELEANTYYWVLLSNEQDATFANFEVTMDCKRIGSPTLPPNPTLQPAATPSTTLQPTTQQPTPKPSDDNKPADNTLTPTGNPFIKPSECNEYCDAYSVMVEDVYTVDEDICITYNVEKMFDEGYYCYDPIKHFVLGLCKGDNIGCNDKDLNGLITSFEILSLDDSSDSDDDHDDDNDSSKGWWKGNGNGDRRRLGKKKNKNKNKHKHKNKHDKYNKNVWGTHSDDVSGIRINMMVYDQMIFEICMLNVFKDDVEFSNNVRFKRGKHKFTCTDDEWVIGLPCIDHDKFVHDSYGTSGYNYYNNQHGSVYNDELTHDGVDNADDNDDQDQQKVEIVQTLIAKWWKVLICIIALICLCIFGVVVYCLVLRRKRLKRRGGQRFGKIPTMNKEDDEYDDEIEDGDLTDDGLMDVTDYTVTNDIYSDNDGDIGSNVTKKKNKIKIKFNERRGGEGNHKYKNINEVELQELSDISL